MAVAWSGQARGIVVEPADHVDIVAKRRQRSEAWRQAKAGTGLGRNPVTLWNSVAVEPQHETVFDRRFRHFTGSCTLCRIGGAGGVEHRYQRRQTNPGATRQRETLE